MSNTPPRVRRVTVSVLVPLAKNRDKVLGVRFRTKRQGKHGIPGGGLELDDDIFATAVAETKEELGLDLPASPDAWAVFAIRCNPKRDSNPGKPLKKYVADCPEDIAQREVIAEHNFDVVLVSRIGCSRDVSELVPADQNEIAEIVEFDINDLPPKEELPISDDFELLGKYADYVKRNTPLPVIMS